MFFCFEQKASYEMRISDWSSDVCSSDLPTGDVPIGVNAAVGKDTRKGLAAMVDIEDGKIASVAFTPTFADEESRPAFLKADDPMFGEIADEIDTITKAAGLSASFTRKDDRVVIS